MVKGVNFKGLEKSESCFVNLLTKWQYKHYIQRASYILDNYNAFYARRVN